MNNTLIQFIFQQVDLPSNKKSQRNQPQHILIGLVFGSDTDVSRKVPTLQPSILGARQQDKAKEETRQESSNMGKIINKWQNPKA